MQRHLYKYLVCHQNSLGPCIETRRRANRCLGLGSTCQSILLFGEKLESEREQKLRSSEESQGLTADLTDS